MKFFVSYSRSVKQDIEKVIELLRASGHDVWWDADIPIIEDWWATILKNIELCEVFIFMVSEKAVQSPYCMEELRYAVNRNRPVLPFIVDDHTHYTIPPELGRRQWFVHNGDPARMLRQINQDCAALDLNRYPDIRVARPIEPGTEGGSLIKIFQQGATLAESGHFDEAIKRFRNVMSLDSDKWGRRCQQWIERLNLYKDVDELSQHKSTLDDAKIEWEKYLEQFGNEFDPLDIRQRLTATAKSPAAHPSNELPFVQPPVGKHPAVSAAKPRSKVYDILPQPFEWVEIPARAGSPGYSIAKYPITNAQFAKFIKAGGYKNKLRWTEAGWKACQRGWKDDNGWNPSGNPWIQPRFWTDKKWNDTEHPVMGVSWHEAVAFCLWLSAAIGEKIMLPTEDQWQYAAQGEDGRTYPWGNEWNCEHCNNSVKPCDSNSTTPVTHYEGKGDSAFGVVDMAGNVWEWCLTDYDNQTNDFNSNANSRVLRGGSWLNSASDNFRCDYRIKNDPHIRTNYNGFRISLS